jgi:hypothetical protein
VNVADIARGVRVSKRRLHPLEELLWEWVAVVERTARLWTEEADAAWVYNERASLSIFAGAVWRVGGVAFEEFSMTKGTGRKRSRGRADIWFEAAGTAMLAEAKQTWTGTGLLRDPGVRVGKALEHAVSDVALCEDYGCLRAGIVFAVPAIGHTKAERVDTHVASWLAKIQDVRCDALAWAFPATCRTKRWKHRLYPGTALLLQLQS